MAKNKDTAERPKKRGLRILLLIILPAALLTAVYIRCNPKWKAAELTIEPAGLPDDSEQQYRNYLKEVMRYAGTLSLQKESEVIPAEELRVGDIICNDVHVVLIADEAVNEKGEKCYLIGQSFIPAVCFHILTHTEGNVTSPWFTEEQLSQDSFVVGSFRFEKDNIRRWKDGF